MARLSVIALLLLAAAVMTKSYFGKSSETNQAMKLAGFSIAKPQAKSDSKLLAAKASVRRATKVVPSKAKPAVTLKSPVQVQKIPIQALAPEQKIARAKQAWENIRVKALDRLRVDQSTRARIDELREEFYQAPTSVQYSDYERSLKDLLGNESYVFLYNAREEFKARVFDRAQVDIGPHLGEL